MEHVMNRSIVKEIALEGGICLLLVAALPVLALLGFALRGAVLVVFVLGVLLCALLYPLSGRFREWFKTKAEIEFCHRGLRLARDVFLHPAHGWARWGGRTVTVGADDLLLSAVGPVEEVDLPAHGTRADCGKPLFRVRRGKRIVEVLSPVSGWVCETNEVLKFYPELMNDLPFGQGWAVRVESENDDRQRRSLLQAGRARAWFRHEVDRAIGETALDDRVRDGALYRRIDSACWDRLSLMFKSRPGELAESTRIVT
jgi:glycine cleavage system H protein